jgi:hypothetical protein
MQKTMMNSSLSLHKALSLWRSLEKKRFYGASIGTKSSLFEVWMKSIVSHSTLTSCLASHLSTITRKRKKIDKVKMASQPIELVLKYTPSLIGVGGQYQALLSVGAEGNRSNPQVCCSSLRGNI